MANGSRGHRIPSQQDFNHKSVPKLITSSDSKVRQGEQSGYYQKTSRTSYVDKQTTKYIRDTNKEVVSTGETFKERLTGRVGYKDEYKITNTHKNRVDYGGCSNGYNKGNYGGSNSSYNMGNYGAGSYNYTGGKAAISNDHCNKYEESEDDEGEGCADSAYSGDSDDHYNKYEESDDDEGEGCEDSAYSGDSDDHYNKYEESDDDEGEGCEDSAYSGDSDGYDSNESNYYSESDSD
ncbi:hypothetical protein CCACVL1_07099 [Corchorus capsularis]|uniref:Uncharacterized protein n=1 Tax=Corchorus capsularis TaxID=210143 RepID=A0A1R3J9M0_COCAP|nr:hypothetical protein CCACVL1_07099 [Corchorus capsularis]